MQSLVELSDVRKVRVPCTDQRPPEQLEGRLVGVEELSPVVIINLVDVDNNEGEADVDNDKDEEEDQDINDHVRHGDDDRPRLSPHEPCLRNCPLLDNFPVWLDLTHLDIPEESHESTNCPETGSNKGHFIALVRTAVLTPFPREGEVAEDEGCEEDEVFGEDVDVLEVQPPPYGLLLMVQPVYSPGDHEVKVKYG